jgi:hypothetical protein
MSVDEKEKKKSGTKPGFQSVCKRIMEMKRGEGE